MLVDLQIDEYAAWAKEHPRATLYIYVDANPATKARLIAAVGKHRTIREVDAEGEIVATKGLLQLMAEAEKGQGVTHKYSAKSTTVDNIKFASKAEAARYCELKLLERAGHIRDLRLQPRFPLMGTRGALKYDSGRTATYVADFEYFKPGHGMVIEDVKGMDTKFSMLKRALMADRGLTVTVVKR